jgi:hypothetical protein
MRSRLNEMVPSADATRRSFDKVIWGTLAAGSAGAALIAALTGWVVGKGARWVNGTRKPMPTPTSTNATVKALLRHRSSPRSSCSRNNAIATTKPIGRIARALMGKSAMPVSEATSHAAAMQAVMA